MKESNEEFKIKPDEIEDEHLLKMKNEIKENNNKMDRLSLRIKDLSSLTQAWDLEQEEAIRKITADYQHLITQKNEYCTFIKEECSIRELSKEESFKTSNYRNLKVMNLQLISTPSDQNLKKIFQDQHLEEYYHMFSRITF